MLTESCDMLATGSMKWNVQFTPSYGGARTGTFGFTSPGFDGGHAIRQVDASEQDDLFIVGTAVRFVTSIDDGFGNGTPIISFWNLADGGIIHVTIGAKTNGSVTAIRGGGLSLPGTLIGASSAGVFLVNTWHYLEAKVRLHDTTGSVEIRIDNTTVLNLTNVDTKNFGASAVFDGFGVHCAYGISGGSRPTHTLDDIYACNEQGSTSNDFLGPIRIYVTYPKTSGTNSGMVNSGGNSTNNYSYVNNNFNSINNGTYSLDWVEGGNVGDKDTYNFYNLSNSSDASTMGYSAPIPSTDSIKAVTINAMVEKSDAGARGLDMVTLKSGTEITKTPTQALVNSTYKLLRASYDVKPGGGSWTMGDVAISEFGYKAT
jgi:hypothetical protein